MDGALTGVEAIDGVFELSKSRHAHCRPVVNGEGCKSSSGVTFTCCDTRSRIKQTRPNTTLTLTLTALFGATDRIDNAHCRNARRSPCPRE
jgi:hypothetical protein